MSPVERLYVIIRVPRKERPHYVAVPHSATRRHTADITKARTFDSMRQAERACLAGEQAFDVFELLPYPERKGE